MLLLLVGSRWCPSSRCLPGGLSARFFSACLFSLSIPWEFQDSACLLVLVPYPALFPSFHFTFWSAVLQADIVDLLWPVYPQDSPEADVDERLYFGDGSSCYSPCLVTINKVKLPLYLSWKSWSRCAGAILLISRLFEVAGKLPWPCQSESWHLHSCHHAHWWSDTAQVSDGLYIF